jgi:hypothetical protein
MSLLVQLLQLAKVTLSKPKRFTAMTTQSFLSLLQVSDQFLPAMLEIIKRSPGNKATDKRGMKVPKVAFLVMIQH